jgi:glycerol-3-phosphate dehydrogenase subunit C
VGRTSHRRLRSAKKVVYFHGCATQYYEPYVGKATIAVLEHNGFEVIVPLQNCCGLPMLSNGEFDAAAGYHRNNVARLAGFARAGFPIVGSSTSCTLTLKEEAPELLDLHDEPNQTLAHATWDIFEFLRDLLEKGELRTDFRRLEMVLPYHAPCQLRAHRIGKPAMDILALVPGLDVRESLARCCGIAGTYGYKEEKYQVAMDVGEELFRFLRAQGKDGAAVPFSACDSETCRWQMEHGTDIPSRHPIEIVAAAYGLYNLETRTLT